MDKDEKPAKRIGRPPKGVGRRQTYNFRMNEGVRDKILASANKFGRSISEEVENRIIESVSEHDLMKRFFGSDETLNLVLLISTAVRLAEVRTGQSWHADIQTQRIVAQSIVNLGHVCGPLGDNPSPETQQLVTMEAAVVSRTSLQMLDPSRFSELNPAGEENPADPRPAPEASDDE